MRLAFLAQCRPHASIGGGRPQFELTREWARTGIQATLLGPEDMLREIGAPADADLQPAFEHWLATRGREFDLVDHDISFLAPLRPPAQSTGPVLVARSVLFLPFTPLLLASDYNSLAKKILVRAGLFRQGLRRRHRQPIARLDRLIPALRRADALNVPTRRDAALAEALGLSPSRILVIPYALDRESRDTLVALPRPAPAATPPHFVFLGSFDSRKGGPDLPRILARILARFPDARLTLLGGLDAAARIRAAFPPALRPALRIVSDFDNTSLPALLAGEAVGLFPSRFEGFPNAVLEQCHAGIPVAAYDAPGASEQLHPSWLVPPETPDDLADLAAGFLDRLRSGEDLAGQARALASRFRIEDCAAQTVTAYENLVRSRRSA